MDQSEKNKNKKSILYYRNLSIYSSNREANFLKSLLAKKDVAFFTKHNSMGNGKNQ